MKSSQLNSPQKICEKILIEEKRYNVERNILPSENLVVDRLLARGAELKNVYEELHNKLYTHPQALQIFLGTVLSAAAFWNPEKINEARAARVDLQNVNQQIAKKAEELANLLRKRSDLHNTSGFSSDTHYHVCEVIEGASQDNYLFQSYVQECLQALHYQFDLKYWPSMSEFLRELAADAAEANIQATDPMTAAATLAIRSSKADFFKAQFAAIEENSAENYGRLPSSFKVSDNTLASLANCALDLGPNDLVDGSYVKRFRQRERNETK